MRPQRYLVITLAATYPGGATNYVTGMLSYRGDSLIEAAVPIGPPDRQAVRAPKDLIDAIDNMITLYHTEVGVAQSMDDFVFTFHEADDLVDLYFLMGQAWVQRRGVSGTLKNQDGFSLNTL
jgi:hypothetical protein